MIAYKKETGSLFTKLKNKSSVIYRSNYFDNLIKIGINIEIVSLIRNNKSYSANKIFNITKYYKSTYYFILGKY